MRTTMLKRLGALAAVLAMTGGSHDSVPGDLCFEDDHGTAQLVGCERTG